MTTPLICIASEKSCDFEIKNLRNLKNCSRYHFPPRPVYSTITFLNNKNIFQNFILLILVNY